MPANAPRVCVSSAIVPVPRGGMPGVVESVGEGVGVVASHGSQARLNPIGTRMTGHALPSQLRCGTRPIGTAVCSTQLQLSAPPRWKFVPVESLNAGPWSAGACFAFAPTAKRALRCRRVALRAASCFTWSLPNRIGTTLRNDNQLRRCFRIAINAIHFAADRSRRGSRDDRNRQRVE